MYVIPRYDVICTNNNFQVRIKFANVQISEFAIAHCFYNIIFYNCTNFVDQDVASYVIRLSVTNLKIVRPRRPKLCGIKSVLKSKNYDFVLLNIHSKWMYKCTIYRS